MNRLLHVRRCTGRRYRGKPHKGYYREWDRFEYDELPCWESMRRRGGKWTDYRMPRTGPLEKFLNAQVGRLWDEVWSEICSADHGGYPTGLRYWTRWLICWEAFVRDGEVWLPRYSRDLYVCPLSGRLLRVEEESEREPQLQRVRVAENLERRLIAGEWHEVRLKPLPTHPKPVWDAVAEAWLDSDQPEEFLRRHGAAVYAVAKRRLPLAEQPVELVRR